MLLNSRSVGLEASVKPSKIQRLEARVPRQERARQKVELILEAAMRLLDKGGLPLLTTNAVAETAGVSIGTLYQYFPNKEAILDALADHEMAALSARVLGVLQDPSGISHEARIGRIVSAVAASYGERRRVHRLVLEHSLSRGARRVAPLVERIMALLTSGSNPTAERSLSEAEAFVLTNAFVGVMRAMITRPDASAPTQPQIEEALARLIVNFAERRA